jgi:hypothetical protein
VEGKEVLVRLDEAKFPLTVVDVVNVKEKPYVYDIVLMDLVVPEKGVSTDSEWRTMSMDMWLLHPRGSNSLCSATRVQKIVDEESLLMLGVVRGSGYFITANESDDVCVQHMDAENHRLAIHVKKGDVVAFVAGPEGMVTVGLNYPRFHPGMETQFTRKGAVDPAFSDQKLSDEFWDMFDSLRKGNL